MDINQAIINLKYEIESVSLVMGSECNKVLQLKMILDYLERSNLFKDHYTDFKVIKDDNNISGQFFNSSYPTEYIIAINNKSGYIPFIVNKPQLQQIANAINEALKVMKDD